MYVKEERRQKGWSTMNPRRTSNLIGVAHGDYELPTTRTELVRSPNGFFTSVFGGWGVRI